MGDADLVRAWQRPDGQIDGLLAVVADVRRLLLGAELDPADVGNADDPVAVLAHDQLFELIGAAQIGVRQQIDLNFVALGAAHGR